MKTYEILTDYELLQIESLRRRILKSKSISQSLDYKKKIDKIINQATERFCALSPEEQIRWVKRLKFQKQNRKNDNVEVMDVFTKEEKVDWTEINSHVEIEEIIPPIHDILSEEDIKKLKEMVHEDQLADVYELLMKGAARYFLV